MLCFLAEQKEAAKGTHGLFAGEISRSCHIMIKLN
jgi:hypothetical protein